MRHGSRSPSVSSWLAAALIASTGACASTVPDPAAGEQIARAVGIEDAIQYCVCGGAVDAQPTTAADLTLADALRLSLQRSAKLQAALANVHVALADAQQARLLPNPILSFVFRFPEGGGRAEIEGGLAFDIATMLKRPRRVSAADSRLRAAATQAVSESLDVVEELRLRYAGVQALDESLQLVRERRALLERLVELAQSRLEFGEGRRVDVTTLQTQLIELDAEVADLELRRRTERLALARLIGEPSGAAEWRLEAWAPPPASLADETAWIAAALDRRPEIQASVLELSALGDDAALAALSKYDGQSLGLAAERDPDFSGGPTLATPLTFFDNGQARRARADAVIVAARYELTELSRRVVEEVRRARAQLESATANLARVRDELIPLQRQRREDIEAIYLAGQTDVTALLLAEQDLQASQAKLVELEERAAVSLTRLERAVGGPAAARDAAQAQPSPQP